MRYLTLMEQGKRSYRSEDKEAVFECDLFGSRQTDSSDDAGKRMGFFELIDGGTIIIKDIEHMPQSSQEKFLKFLETGNFSREGSSESAHSDVRVIVTYERH